MEYDGHSFLEEFLALRSDHFETTIPAEMNGLYNSTNVYNLDCFDNYPIPIFSNSSFDQEFSLPMIGQTQNFNSFNEVSAPEIMFPTQEDHSLMSSIFEDEEQGLFGNIGIQNLEIQAPCKVEEPIQSITHDHEVTNFEMGLCLERKSKIKKIDGQPSKNLMAERRRRKRLNDRLSMLRSVVPKISKMDRTSILGDTIDYMKELLERINNLQEESDQEGPNQLKLMSIFKDVKPNEVMVRNSPKFEVERREMDTRIEICCSGKPGLLLSTVTTLEALGLEIQQCVISCFNDFAMQASCSERGSLSSEDIKQALFRNAGYGGRCV